MPVVTAKLRKSATVSAVVATSLTLSGCSMGRVNEVKGQFCDFDSNFSYSTGTEPHFTFEQPVLLESDVAAIIGYEPAETTFLHRKLMGSYMLCTRIKAKVNVRALIVPHLPAVA